jgi:hypothetical protein
VLGCRRCNRRGNRSNGRDGALFLLIEEVLEARGRSMLGCGCFDRLRIDRAGPGAARFGFDRLEAGPFDPNRSGIGGGRLRFDWLGPLAVKFWLRLLLLLLLW